MVITPYGQQLGYTVGVDPDIQRQLSAGIPVEQIKLDPNKRYSPATYYALSDAAGGTTFQTDENQYPGTPLGRQYRTMGDDSYTKGVQSGYYDESRDSGINRAIHNVAPYIGPLATAGIIGAGALGLGGAGATGAAGGAGGAGAAGAAGAAAADAGLMAGAAGLGTVGAADLSAAGALGAVGTGAATTIGGTGMNMSQMLLGANAVAGVAGAGLGYMAQQDATKQASNASNAALAQQNAMYQQQRADFAPYQQMGVTGVENYNKFVADPTAYLNTPAYQWQQSQIDKNMNRQLSARGRSNSSYGMNSLANAYGNLGVQEYQNSYNRMLDPIKIGQGAANSTGAAAQNMSNAYAQNGVNQANTAMANGQNQASLYSGAAGALGNTTAAYLNYDAAMNSPYRRY